MKRNANDDLSDKIKLMTGLTMSEKAILYQLAFESSDGKTVSIPMKTLCSHAGCSYSTAQRVLGSLERRGLLIPQGDKKGRGAVHVYCFNLEVEQQHHE